MGAVVSRTTEAEILGKLHSGQYTSLGYAKRAINRTLLKPRVKATLLREAERHFGSSSDELSGSRTARGAKTLAEYLDDKDDDILNDEDDDDFPLDASELEKLNAELVKVEARRADLLKQIESAKIQQIVVNDPERVRRALELLERTEGAEGPEPLSAQA